VEENEKLKRWKTMRSLKGGRRGEAKGLEKIAEGFEEDEEL